MSDENYLKCSCKECGNNIEFPPAAAGQVVECPHCKEWTELKVEDEEAVDGEDAPGKSKLSMLAAVAVGMVIVAAIAAVIFFRARSKTAVEQPAPPLVKVTAAPTNLPPTNAAPAKPVVVEKKPKSLDDLKVSAVQLEKAKVGSLVYAIGTVTNASEYQRFGVKVELNLFNSNGKKLGVTKDYKDIIEPHREWQFHAMVLDAKTTAAAVSSITEE
jgi:hypothetical protein